jgi:hypothetical protein
LPIPPYVDGETTVKRLTELVSFCKRSHVEAVAFYVNFRSNWYYMPDTKEHALVWASEMKEIVPQIRDAGISYQLNIQDLLGHQTGGVDFREDYPWEYLVDERGNVNLGCACPVGPRFREIMGQQLRDWAATEPDVIWIDDDFRLFNHGSGKRGMDWYCFCPSHLEWFSKKYGARCTREELVASILKPGEPSLERLAWLDFQNETMKDTCSWVSNEIHKMSPNTRVAQMISHPDAHAVEGRNWGDFLENLSGKGLRPIVRPTFGPYTEGTPVGFVNSYRVLDQSLVSIRMHYPRKVDAFPEIENTRFTRWAKSGAATRFQLWLGQLMGCSGITLSLYDLEGTPLDEEPLYERVLVDEKPALDQLASLQLDKWKRRGVGLLADPDAARKVQVSGGDDISRLLGPGRTWDYPLLQLGIPVCYFSPEDALKAEVVALDGLSAWLPNDSEMRVLLSHGVLLDSNASDVLIRRGYGLEIGVDVESSESYQTSSEIFHGNIIYGLPEKRMPMRLVSERWSNLILKDGAKEVTTIIDPKGIGHAGTVIFENSLGGRIASYAGSVELGAEFYNHTRALWSLALLNWLSKDKFPLCMKATQRFLSIRRDFGQKTLLAFANLAIDPLDEIRGTLRDIGEIKSVRYLSSKGKWEKAEFSYFRDGDKKEYEFSATTKLQVYDWFVTLVEAQ